MPEIKASPRNRLLGAFADVARNVNDFAAKPFGYDNPPVAMMAGLLGLPAVASTLNELSYGGALGTGSGMTWKPKADTVDAAMTLLPLGATAGKAAIDGGVALAKKAAPAIERAVPRIMERGGLPAQLLGDLSQNTVSPATVWHGSPHKFDKFDASKIGTGEGKQQQGIGAYLAEAQQVGQKYADKEAWKRGMDSGYLYKIDMPDEMIASMANHDAPFASQPNKVKEAIAPMFGAKEMEALKGYHGWDNLDDAPFSAVLDSMEITRGNNRAATSEALRQAGIPGIRYLDGGSRGTGAGTSNFVVFPGNEGLLTILERNGQKINDAPGLLAPKFVYPQEKALLTAQKNAALPVEQGGLGLRPDNTPMERAKALGGVDAFSGTKSNVGNIDLSKAGVSDPGLVGKAFYSTPSAEQASTFAMSPHYGSGDSPNVMPLMLLPQKTAISQDGQLLGKSLSEIHPQGITKQSASKINKELSKAGYDTVQFNLGDEPMQYASLNPVTVRSRFAAFDPMRINENDLLGRASPGLLGLIGGGTGLGLLGNQWLTDR